MAEAAGLPADGVFGSSLRVQNYPLSLEFVPGTPLRAVVTYDRGLHRGEDIDTLVAELTDIITSMVRDVSAPLHTLLAP